MKALPRRVNVGGLRVKPLVVVGVTGVLVMGYWMMANDPLIPDHIPGGKLDDILLLVLAAFGLVKLLNPRN